ncbi:MAG: type IV pilus modification protein PilV [Pseudoxanthomonas sp.]
MSSTAPRAPAWVTAGGFSLIEVLVAILVLGFGLLGFALLQSMSLRFTQSADHRTQATNLVYDLLDQVRSNRADAARYVGSFDSSADACQPATGAGMSAADYLGNWRCRMYKALGEGATGVVERNGDQIEVSVSWGDERWVEGSRDTRFGASTRL